MKTADIFAQLFLIRTTGRRASFTVNVLSLDAVKVVLKGACLVLDAKGAEEDADNGYLRRKNGTGYYGGCDGYIPTAKGWKAIFEKLQ